MFATLVLLFQASQLAHGFNIREESQSLSFTNDRNGSEFGYSIALHENDEGKWLLVGAPKDSDRIDTTNSKGPRDGAVYECPLKETGGPGEESDECYPINERIRSEGSASTLLSDNFESGAAKFEQLTGDDFDWEPHAGPTSSDQTGPSFDHTTKDKNGTYMLLEASHPRTVGETAMIRTPVMPLTNAACVRFWYHMRGSSVGSLNVYSFTNATGSRMIWSIEHDQGDDWHEGWVTVIPQAKYQIIFEGVIGQDYNSDIGLDDVSMMDGACAEDNQPGKGSLGMTLTTDHRTGQVLTCAPTWSYSCKGQNHATGLCYLFDKDMSAENSQMLTPCRSSSCNEGQMDLIFLIDGSDSVNILDFRKMLRWLNNVISSLSVGKDMTRVGVAQYSSSPRTEFHLNQYFKIEDLRKAIKEITYMRKTTATGRAIDFISDEMFTVERGTRPDAKHVAVVVTDGKSQDDVVPPSERAKARGITLFAIGVGVAVESELRNISSDPDEQFVYSVNSYKALDGIRGQFQRKLYSLESQGSTFTTEQCQSGTSASFVDGQPVLGLPGLQDWSGGFALYQGSNSSLIKSNLQKLLQNQANLDFLDPLDSVEPTEPTTTQTVSASYSQTTVEMENVKVDQTLVPQSTTSTRSKRSPESDKTEDLIKKATAHAYFGYSMSSGSYSHSSSLEVAIGAPRLSSRGGVFIVQASGTGGTNFTLVDSFFGEQMGSYFGYSVCMTDMNNDGMDEVLVGAPLFMEKFEDMGQVEIYISAKVTTPEESRRTITFTSSSEEKARFGFSVRAGGNQNGEITSPETSGQKMILTGSTENGSRFGFSITTEGDHNVEEKETAWDSSRRKITLQGSSERNARFGFSIAAAGDLNGDGYGDVVIGAPSNADGDGAIYIYNGREDLESLRNPSQVLRASRMIRKPVYFGFSVHSEIDVDGNGYPDIASGAPGSSQAFVMLSKPVIHVKAYLASYPSVVNISQPSCYLPRGSASTVAPKTCATIEICFETAGKGIPQIVLLKFALNADFNREADFVRAYFDNYKNELGVISESDTITCSNVTLFFKEPVYDVSSDVVIRMQYGLSDSISYTENSAVLDMYDMNPVYSKVTLARSCQNKNCEADLKVGCSVSGIQEQNGTKILILEDDRILTLNLDLENFADDAYHVTIYVRYYDGLYMSHLQQARSCVSVVEDESGFVKNQSSNGEPGHVIAGETDKHLLLKYINPIMRRNEPCSFKLQFGIANQSAFYGRPLTISVKVKSPVADLNLEDNSCGVDLPLYFKAKVVVVGKAENPLLPFSPKKEEQITSLSDVGPNVTYTYFVQNQGYIEIPSSSIETRWPSKTKLEQDILYLTGVDCLPRDKCVCNNTHLFINPYHLNVSDDNSTIRTTVSPPEDLNQTTVPTEVSRKSKKELWMNCKEDGIHCESLKCIVTDLKPTEIVQVTLDFRIWERTMGDMKVWRGHLATTAKYTIVSSPQVFIEPSTITREAMITTFSLASHPNISGVGPATPRMWVIILAVIAGIIVLCLLILALYKVGFFESKYRQKKEETLEWRDYQQYSAAHEGRVHQPAEGEKDSEEHKLTTFQRRGN